MKLLELINQYEERNNLSISVELFGDGSCVIKDFWSEKNIQDFEDIAIMEAYLKDTQYELAPSGRCYDPPREAKKG